MASRNRISRLISRCTPSRRVPHTPPPQDTVPPPPWWVRAFTAAGRPIVAIAVLVMSAPGEHHLAVLAGWNTHLAWGMAFVLAAYAGIAAVVAATRPAGAPGKKSAVLGAVLSLGLAMSAQPVSHMFVVGHWTADPRPPVWLVWVVSCIPPLVLGHLLHLAATSVPRARQAQAAGTVERDTTAEPAARTPLAPFGPTALPWSIPVAVPTRATARPALPTAKQDSQDTRPLTTADLAAKHGVKPDTVRKWVTRGNITPLPERDTGGGYLFAPDAAPALAVAAG